MDAHDNCDGVFNPAQLDSNLDGRGDLVGCPVPEITLIDCDSSTSDLDNDGVVDFCDTCPPAACVGGLCDPFNPAQEPCQFIAPDGDGDGPLDEWDNCPAVANAGQENTNHLVEEIFGDLVVVGDACDATPVARFDVTARASTTPGSSSMGRFSTLGVAAAAASASSDTSGGPDHRSWQVTGYRFCDCPDAERNTIAEHRACRENGCRTDWNEYGAPVSGWHPMTLEHDTPVYGPNGEALARYRQAPEQVDRAGETIRGSWDYLADYAAWGLDVTTTTLGPTTMQEVGTFVWTMSRGEVHRDDRLPGDARDDGFYDCADEPAGCAPLARNINARSSYWSGRLREGAGVPRIPPPSLTVWRPRFPFPDFGLGCPECRAFFPRPLVGLGAAPGLHALAATESADLQRYDSELFGGVDADVLSALAADLQWTAAGRATDAPGAVLLGLHSDGGVGALVERRSDGSLGLGVPALGALPGYRTDRPGRLVLDASRGRLWSFEGWSDVTGRSEVWNVDLASGRSRRMVLHRGELPEMPLPPPPEGLCRPDLDCGVESAPRELCEPGAPLQYCAYYERPLMLPCWLAPERCEEWLATTEPIDESDGVLAAESLPGDVLAVAIHPSGRRAVLVDRRPWSSTFQMFTVDLYDGRVEEMRDPAGVIQWPGSVSAHVQLRWLRDDTILMVVGTPAAHRVRTLRVQAETLTEVARYDGVGPILEMLALDSDGVSIYGTSGGVVTPLGVGWEDLAASSTTEMSDAFR